MSQLPSIPAMMAIPASVIRGYLDSGRAECLDLVREAYLVHDRVDTSLPHSSFLRLPGHDRDRIIALPGYLGGSAAVAGIKWISSWPGNVEEGLPRASAVLVLNDTRSGFPIALLEASLISASRTAASAVLAAEALNGGRHADRVGFVGAGFIAEHVRCFFRDLGWRIAEYRVFDVVAGAARAFAERIESDTGRPATVASDVAAAIEECDLVVFATVAATPHIDRVDWFAHRPVVLHVSLRDLAVDVVLGAQNITDDISHVMRESTSLHLAEQQTGSRAFVAGTLADVLNGRVGREPRRTVIFSPFGLGVLDLALANWLYGRAVADGVGQEITGFFDGIAV